MHRGVTQLRNTTTILPHATTASTRTRAHSNRLPSATFIPGSLSFSARCNTPLLARTMATVNGATEALALRGGGPLKVKNSLSKEKVVSYIYLVLIV